MPPDWQDILFMDKIETTDQYNKSLKFLYSQLPMFSRVGAAAYKPGLDRTLALDRLFDHPHEKFKSIHIAGTNGKGSTSHMLAAILQANGYKTGLYTSPHLVDFRERIRVNGEMIPMEAVTEFTDKWIKLSRTSDISPSFFELTMMMAFNWFAMQKVDYAIIETGMGGRLDSTNIITPEISVITNISFDHTQFLGDTLEKIASEKAGIIKRGIPVIIGEATPDTATVFDQQAKNMGAPIYHAYTHPEIIEIKQSKTWGWDCKSSSVGGFTLPLAGIYQKYNINTVLTTVKVMQETGINLNPHLVCEGIENVIKYTGLRGRWMKIADSPLTICDTGHNEAGIKEISTQLKELIDTKKSNHLDAVLRIVIGFVADKDIDHILPLLPSNAIYYISQASIPRAMDADALTVKCQQFGLHTVFTAHSVKDAYAQALSDASTDDIIFIGGSTFVVADFLS